MELLLVTENKKLGALGCQSRLMESPLMLHASSYYCCGFLLLTVFQFPLGDFNLLLRASSEVIAKIHIYISINVPMDVQRKV